MKIEQLEPKPTEKQIFHLSAFNTIPKSSGCYVLASPLDDILYIGLTKNFYIRFKQHLKDTKKTSLTAAGRPHWFYYYEYDINNLEKLERTWIQQFENNNVNGHSPILNEKSSPIH